MQAQAKAEKLTVLEKLEQVPTETWLSLLTVAFMLWLLVRVWKSLAELNETIPWIVFFVFGGITLTYWTYERTEPGFLTPLIDLLAHVLPTKSS